MNLYPEVSRYEGGFFITWKGAMPVCLKSPTEAIPFSFLHNVDYNCH